MFDEMTTPTVESALVEMAGHIAAGTCRFLQLLAEFDRRDGWSGPGLKSCAHWLNWRVGLNLRTARDHLRVARTLERLPATTAAFAAGRLSYSKVRALTRIATPATEEALLDVALHGTTSQLESLVRATRASTDPRPATARRALRWTWAEDGSLLVSLRIPAERGHEFLAAIQTRVAEEHAAPDPGAAQRPDTSADDLGLDDLGLDDLGERAEHHRVADAERHHLRARAEEHAPGPTVDPAAARRLDALLDLVADQGLDRPTTLVVHLRADDAEPTDGGAHPANPGNPGNPGIPGNPGNPERSGPRPLAWIEGGPAVPPIVAARLACTSAAQALLVDRRGNPLHLGRARRTATRAQLRALRVRDGDRCVFPGCTTTRGLQAHHIRWWAFGGRTDLDNLALVCRFHHTLVHDHGYRLRRGPQGLAVARPDGTAVPAAGPPGSTRADELVARHTAQGLAIDDWTITPHWGGERLDRDHLLTWLLPELGAEAA